MNSKDGWSKSALLVIDMQNDFVVTGGPMHVAGGLSIIPNVQKATEFARSKGALVVWVIREHDPSGTDVEKFRRTLYDGKGGPTSKGCEGAALVQGLVKKEEDYAVCKFRFSAFFATNLDMVLRRAGISNLIVTGVQTPNCIRATVFDALALDYTVTVLEDATAAATPEIHQANLLDMRNVSVSTPTLAQWMTE